MLQMLLHNCNARTDAHHSNQNRISIDPLRRFDRRDVLQASFEDQRHTAKQIEMRWQSAH